LKKKSLLLVSVWLLMTCIALTTPAWAQDGTPGEQAAVEAVAATAVGPTLADLAGTWNFNAFVTGPGAPWWERLTMVVKPNGTFSGSGTQSTGNPENFTGAFKVSSGGLLLGVTGGNSGVPCQIDLGATVMSCTETWPQKAGSAAGSTNLIIGTRQAAPGSYSNDDLVAADWEANGLDGGPTNPSWMRISGDSIDIDGIFQGSYSDSNGGAANVAGQLALSANGEVTCVSGDCPDPNYTSYIDASKTVSVGTYGVSDTNPDAVLTVFTKMAPSGSYSMDDLVGIWNFNILASGSGAPFWDRGTFSIKPDGTSTISSVQSNGKKKTETGPTFAISSDGVITGGPGRAVMNAGKTVMVETDTWQDGSGTTEIGIFTKSEGLPDAPTGVSATPGNAQAKVTFTPPAANGSAITGFTVTSSPGGIIAKGKKSPITVKGLTNGDSYTFTVTATNKIGTGAPSSSSAPVTPKK
jgi:hypothetical protein